MEAILYESEDGNVYNCSLFVGKNGSGKTTILQNIIVAILGSESSSNLLIWQDENKNALQKRKARCTLYME